MPKPPEKIDHINTESLPQGYDVGNSSGTMDEQKGVHDVKNKKPEIGSESNAYKVPPGNREAES